MLKISTKKIGFIQLMVKANMINQWLAIAGHMKQSLQMN